MLILLKMLTRIVFFFKRYWSRLKKKYNGFLFLFSDNQSISSSSISYICQRTTGIVTSGVVNYC